MDAMVPDSAATAFSMYSGVKSNTFTMGYDTNIKVSQSSGRISFLLQFVFPKSIICCVQHSLYLPLSLPLPPSPSPPSGGMLVAQ